MTRELQVIQTPDNGTWMTELEAHYPIWLVKERQVAEVVVQFIYDLHGGEYGTVSFRRLTFSILGIVTSSSPQVERWTCDADGRGFDGRPLFLPAVWVDAPRPETPMHAFFDRLHGREPEAGQFDRSAFVAGVDAASRESRTVRTFVTSLMPADVPLPPGMVDDIFAAWGPQPTPTPIEPTRFSMVNR